jgi:hypothetical protein
VPELGEAVGLMGLDQELEAKCPFNEDEPGGPEASDESIGDDDKDDVQPAQANDGGILGENLEAGRAGKADGGPYPPTDFLYRQPANDTKRGRMTRLRIKAYRDAAAGDFPFTVAAHHLIPGNASLYKSDVKLVDYMKKGGSVKTVAGSTKTIKHHIGYDVNGSHNAVWLPGNYAIKTALPERKTKKGAVLPAREGTTPIAGESWERLSTDYADWQYDYVAGACKAADGQFHDSHERPYSASVRKELLKMVTAMASHLDTCPLCKDKTEIPPPYRMKRRLYAFSKRLRMCVTGSPGAWKDVWFTSEKWSQRYFAGGRPTLEFRRKYAEAVETRPHVVGEGRDL